MKKLNCWEYMKCGHEPGGTKAEDRGACPASTESKFDGLHGGINAGRACWAIVGTMCNDRIQHSFSSKIKNCLECDFHVLIKKEEDRDFLGTFSVLKMRK